MIEPTRTAEVLVAGHWQAIPFKDLKEGDIFRLFEEDGTAVDDGEIYEAETSAYVNDGLLTIKNRLGGRVLNEEEIGL